MICKSKPYPTSVAQWAVWKIHASGELDLLFYRYDCRRLFGLKEGKEG